MPTAVFRLALALGLLLPAAALAEQGAGGSPMGNSGRFGERRGSSPGQATNELSVRFDLGGGYDDDVIGRDTAPGDPVPRQGDYAQTGSASIRYFKGRGTRFMDLAATGFVNDQRSAVARVYGGETSFRGATNLGRRSGMTADVGAAYQPMMILRGQQQPLSPAGAEPPVLGDANLTTPPGVLNERWLLAQGRVGVFHNWSPRHRLDANFWAAQREPIQGTGFAARSQVGTLQHIWTVRRNFGFTFAYQLDETRQDQGGGVIPLRLQTGSIGIRTERYFSSVRSLTFTGTVGLTQAAFSGDIGGGTSATSTEPSGSARAEFQISRRLTMSGEVSRFVTALGGVTVEPFVTHSGMLSLFATVSDRVSIGALHWITNGTSRTEGFGGFGASNSIMNVHVALARCCSLFGSYSYYQHRLSDLPSAPSAFPARYERQSVRAGLTFWMPVYRGS